MTSTSTISTPIDALAAFTAFTAESKKTSSPCDPSTIRTRFDRTGLSPTVPIMSLVRTLPSTYNEFTGSSLRSEAFTNIRMENEGIARLCK